MSRVQPLVSSQCGRAELQWGHTGGGQERSVLSGMKVFIRTTVDLSDIVDMYGMNNMDSIGGTAAQRMHVRVWMRH